MGGGRIEEFLRFELLPPSEIKVKNKRKLKIDINIF